MSTPAARPEVDAYVLGPLVVRRAGQPVELGPLRRRATLAALLVDSDRVVPLDTLLDRVWDSDPPDSAVTAVQAYLSRLRAAFRRAGGGDDDAGWPIVTEHPGYRLAVPRNHVDAERFSTAVADARAARERGDVRGASRTVRAGLALWRGEPYADVVIATTRREAERLTSLRHSAQTLAVELDLALGRHHDVLDELRDLVRVAPLAEQVHGLYMTALHRAGRQAEALDHFARVRELLADELGVDPGRELQDLHARMLRGDPALDDVPLTTPPVVVASEPPPMDRVDGSEVLDTVDTTPGAPPLIGRAAEAATLRATLDDAAQKGFRAVAVVGEAGIGKTRLLEEAAAHARRSGALVAWGRSWQHDGAPRLWPFAQALRVLAAEVGPAAFVEAAGTGADILALVVPDLVPDRDSSAPVDVVGDLERSELRVLDAVAQVLTGLARARPVVLVLEDMHWADATSRRTTEYLVTHLHAPGIALVVSVRWPSDEASATTGALLAGLARGGGLVRIDLTGFDAADVRDYVADRTGSVIDDATSAALVDRTDGNPFFVGEIVRLVVTDSPTVGDVEVTNAEVPDTVRAVVLARMDRVDPADREVLDAAAVVGRSFDLDVLVAASGRDEDVVDEAVDRATAAGVLGTEPGAPGVHRFAHALVQQTLLEAIGPARRRRVHARVAAELARREVSPGVPRDPDQLVYHLAGAGGDDALTRAVAICVTQADTARARGDFASAEAVLLRAVDLASRLRGADAPLAELSARLRLYSLYNLVAPSSDVARSHHARAVHLAREYGRPDDLLVALQAAYAEAIIRMDVPAMTAVEEEQSVAGEAMDHDGLRLGSAVNRTQRLFYTGRVSDALTSADEVIAFLTRPEVTVPPGAFPIHPARLARWFRATSLSFLGRDDEAAAQGAALDDDDVIGGRDAHTTTYINLLVALWQGMRGDPDRALDAVARTRAAQQVAGTTDGAVYVDVVEAWAHGRRRPGDRPDAIGDLLRPYDHMPSLGTRAFLRGLQADVLLLAGRPAEAVAAVQRGLDEIDRNGERLYEPWLARLGALAATRAGEDVLADRWRARSFAAAERIGLPVAPVDAQWKFLTAAHREGI
ncbi:BTAD domain-containing putative transcriptional regulator [Jatrophihabitans sp. YIM 134969]